MKKSKFLYVFLILFLILFTACKKDAENNEVTANKEIIENKDIAENQKVIENKEVQENQVISDNKSLDNNTKKQVVEILYTPKNRYELKELLKDENIKLDTIDVSLIKNLSYIFKGTNRKDFEGIDSWNVPNTVLQYNTFKGTPIENNPPSWYYDNPPEILYTPANKDELINLIYDNDNIYLGNIDVSKITDLSEVKLPCNGLSGIEYWDVSNVENMYKFTFCNNVEIGHLDVSKVKYMGYLFAYEPNFNGDISDWNVSNVQEIKNMFNGAVSFNQDISSWNVSKVENMAYMFAGAESFNQNLNPWNISNVWDMSYMFAGAKNFNQYLDSWNTSNVGKMDHMFEYASKFNGKIDNWDVSGVGDFSYMFYGAAGFNQDLSNWGYMIGEWTKEYEPGEKSVTLDDMFTNSPLEKTPPQWYSNMIYDETDDKEEYAFDENTLDGPECEKLSDASEDGFDPDMWYTYRCVFADDVSMESVYKGVLKTIADKVSKELEQNNDLSKQELYEKIKELQNKEENYSFSQDYGRTWLEIGAKFIGDSIIINTNEAQGEESYSYIINNSTSDTAVTLSFEYDSGF